MRTIRSIITHLLIAILGGGVALGGHIILSNKPVSTTDATEPSNKATVSIEKPAGPKSPTPAPTIRELKKASRAFVTVAKAVQPAVVNINTVQIIKSSRTMGPQFRDPFFEPFEDFFGHDMFRHFFQDRRGAVPEQRRQSLGSGMIIDAEKGYVLTNNHVVENADEIKITLSDGRDFKGKIVGTDPQTDVGVIQIIGKPKNLVAVKLGDSDQVEVGDWAIAVGNPFGLTQTVTLGIISAKGRANVNVVDYEDFIQTDAAINPGNSGGPLLNVHGNVIGINTAIFSRSGGYQGIGFAIPSNMAKYVLEKLIKGEEIERGYLGVYLQDLTDALAKKFGVDSTDGSLVAEVAPDSPADHGGLKTGDIIIAMNGSPVKSPNELRNKIAFSAVGSTITLTIIRNGKQQDLSITLGKRPAKTAKVDRLEKQGGKLGVTVANLNNKYRGKYRTNADHGVVIVEVDPNGLMARTGIREGDVIMEINRKVVEDVDSFKSIVKKIDPKDGILLLLDRQGQKLFLALNP